MAQVGVWVVLDQWKSWFWQIYIDELYLSAQLQVGIAKKMGCR